MKFALSFLSLLVAGASASNVLELVPDTWDSVIGQKPGLVEFFAPWCGHCKNLAPVYEQLADAFAHKQDKVAIVKVDADGEGRPLGEKYGVTGFPTLKWFDAAGNAEPYEGARDLDALAAFVSLKSGVKSNIKPPPPPATLVLDTHTFDDVVLNAEHDTLVAFTAPWCGHCKKLKPTFEEVAKDFALEKNCIVANVDADAEPNRPLAARYGVQSYPTLRFFPKGGAPIPYEGARTEAAFVDFLNTHCGTHRTVGGALSDLAGRLPDFDAIAGRFFAAEAGARQAILGEAQALADAAGPAAKHYLRVMEKVVNGTEGYLEKESKRLSSILTKKTMAPSKLDELKIKANILAAFAEKKVEEVVAEVTGDKHDEL